MPTPRLGRTTATPATWGEGKSYFGPGGTWMSRPSAGVPDLKLSPFRPKALYLSFWGIGDRGLLVDMVPLKDAKGYKLDDDHVLAVFRRNGLWGCVAKSNFPWLRYREPVYRTIRELVMSYFEPYFSMDSIKVLRGYTRPFNIARHDRLDYAWDEAGATRLYRRFYAQKDIPLIPPESERLLNPADKREYESAFMGVNWDWVYRPQK